MGFPLVSLSFAVFAIVYIIRYTDGPFDIFVNFRGLVGIQKIFDQYGGFTEEIKDSFFAKLFSCFWCTATWVSLLFVILFHGYDILLWFACIGVSGFLHEIIVREDG